MSEEKLRISVIDFIPFYGKFKAGKDKNGEDVFYGDTVKYNNNEYYLLAYRYGKPILKQIGIMAMIGSAKYDEGEFYNCERQNVMTAGQDWLIIGYENEHFIQQLKSLEL